MSVVIKDDYLATSCSLLSHNFFGETYHPCGRDDVDAETPGGGPSC